MFFPKKMVKMDVFVPRDFIDQVSREVIRFGDFQLLRIDAEKARGYHLLKTDTGDFQNRFHDLEKRASYLGSLFEEYSIADGLSESSVVSVPEFTVMSEKAIERRLREIEIEVNSIQREREELNIRKNTLEIKIIKQRYFASQDADLAVLSNLKSIYAGFGIIPSGNLHNLLQAVAALPVEYRVVETVADNLVLFFFTPMDFKEKLEGILKNLFFRDFGLPQEGETAASGKRLLGLAFDLVTLHDTEQWLDGKWNRLAAGMAPVLDEIRLNLQYYKSMDSVRSDTVSTTSVSLLSGWVPADKSEELNRRINEVTGKSCVVLEESALDVMERDGLEPPTRFSNPAIFRPFEGMVATFGIPNYREIDPTPLAAISYTLIYGAMFGDVGHGLIMIAAGLLGVFLKKLSGLRSLLTILLYIGLSSVVFGLLYGEFFGTEVFKPLWIKPLHSPMQILMVAVYFGMFVLSLGIILSIINSWREKNYGRLFFSPNGVAGLALYWSGIAIILGMVSGKPLPSLVAIIPAVSLVLIGMEKFLEHWFFPHKGHGHDEKPSAAVGVVEVFETVISLLSKTVSFMRVGAFAMNHAALMGAFFVLAGMTTNPVAKAIIVVIGNVFVIGFEGAIVGIQALRLQYYEFFVSFFRANGKPFDGVNIYRNK